MRSAVVCVAILLAASSSAGALESKKKVVSVVETLCDGKSDKAKKLDCKTTGSVSGTTQPQPTADKPRLGYTGSPWIFSGF